MTNCHPIIIEQPNQCSPQQQISGASILIGILGTVALAFAAISILQATDGRYNSPSQMHSFREIHYYHEAQETMGGETKPSLAHVSGLRARPVIAPNNLNATEHGDS